MGATASAARSISAAPSSLSASTNAISTSVLRVDFVPGVWSHQHRITGGPVLTLALAKTQVSTQGEDELHAVVTVAVAR